MWAKHGDCICTIRMKKWGGGSGGHSTSFHVTVYLRIVLGNVKAMVGCMHKHDHDVEDEIVNGCMFHSDAQTFINWEGENSVKNKLAIRCTLRVKTRVSMAGIAQKMGTITGGMMSGVFVLFNIHHRHKTLQLVQRDP